MGPAGEGAQAEVGPGESAFPRSQMRLRPCQPGERDQIDHLLVLNCVISSSYAQREKTN